MTYLLIYFAVGVAIRSTHLLYLIIFYPQARPIVLGYLMQQGPLGVVHEITLAMLFAVPRAVLGLLYRVAVLVALVFGFLYGVFTKWEAAS